MVIKILSCISSDLIQAQPFLADLEERNQFILYNFACYKTQLASVLVLSVTLYATARMRSA